MPAGEEPASEVKGSQSIIMRKERESSVIMSLIFQEKPRTQIFI